MLYKLCSRDTATNDNTNLPLRADYSQIRNSHIVAGNAYGRPYYSTSESHAGGFCRSVADHKLNDGLRALGDRETHRGRGIGEEENSVVAASQLESAFAHTHIHTHIRRQRDGAILTSK